MKKNIKNILWKFEEYRIKRSPFYVKYPYMGQLPLRSIDWHTVIDYELGIMFHRIQKVANSSLLASVMQIKEGREMSVEQVQKRQLRGLFLRPSKVAYKDLGLLNDLYKFVFVRNPYTRILSAYLSKVDGKIKSGKKVNIRYYKGSGPSADYITSFEQFCNFLDSGGIHANRHWAPQNEFLIFPLSDYNFIGRFERLSEDFKKVISNFKKGERKWGIVDEDSGHATGSEYKLDKYYSRETFDIINKLYKKDFESFGYEKQ